jgi:FkbH-like protein
MIDYFLAPEINFGSKADSLRRISAKLDMDLRHFAFIDDDPFERSLVCKMLPEVRVFDAVEYDNLLTMQCFNPDMITEESLRRRERVRNELARQDAESNAPDLERFLKSCEVRYQFRPAVIADQDRILELILRTNRMNASGRIFTATELAMLIKSSSHQVFIASMSDRFGEYGIVAAAIATKIADAFRVEGLWLSCRVARRELPHCIYTSLADLSQELGCKSLEISYRATNYNRLALFHMSQYGFKFKENEFDSDSRILQIMTPFGRRPYPRWIKVN